MTSIGPEYTFESAINVVCHYLPAGWDIRIELERGAGCVKLFAADGSEVEFDPSGDLDITEQLEAAINKAIYFEEGQNHV